MRLFAGVKHVRYIFPEKRSFGNLRLLLRRPAGAGRRITPFDRIDDRLYLTPDPPCLILAVERLIKSARLLADSNATIDTMVADIDAAEDHVHLLFYIWLADNNGCKVVERSSERSGVVSRAGPWPTTWAPGY